MIEFDQQGIVNVKKLKENFKIVFKLVELMQRVTKITERERRAVNKKLDQLTHEYQCLKTFQLEIVDKLRRKRKTKETKKKRAKLKNLDESIKDLNDSLARHQTNHEKEAIKTSPRNWKLREEMDRRA